MTCTVEPRFGPEPLTAPWKPPVAAAYLGTTANYLAQMRHRGEGPAYIKRGRRILYRHEDLDAWLDARRVVPERDR